MILKRKNKTKFNKLKINKKRDKNFITWFKKMNKSKLKYKQILLL